MIRAARPEDVAAIVALNLEAQQLHVRARPERYREPTPTEVEPRIRALLEDRDATVLVADRDDAVVGYVIVRRADAPASSHQPARRVAHVAELAVRAEARRGGLGRALMSAAEARAREWGATSIELDVQAFNGGAADFYRTLGFGAQSVRFARALADEPPAIGSEEEAPRAESVGFAAVTCPWCFERVEITVEADVEGGFVQDCEVCCRPWNVHVAHESDGALHVDVDRA